LTCAGRPRTATLATSSTPGGRETQRHRRRQATIHSGVGATTAVRTAHRHQSPRGPACSAERSARRASRSASASPRPSTSTRGRQTPVYCSTTIAWHASWVGPPLTRSSSATCRYTSPTRRGRGSSTCRPVRSTTGTTYPHLRGELPGDVRAPWELLGFARMHLEARRVAPRLHTVLLQALYGAPEHRPVRDRARLPRGYDLPGPHA
jgi:hypothetical protein